MPATVRNLKAVSSCDEGRGRRTGAGDSRRGHPLLQLTIVVLIHTLQTHAHKHTHRSSNISHLQITYTRTHVHQHPHAHTCTKSKLPTPIIILYCYCSCLAFSVALTTAMVLLNDYMATLLMALSKSTASTVDRANKFVFDAFSLKSNLEKQKTFKNRFFFINFNWFLFKTEQIYRNSEK